MSVAFHGHITCEKRPNKARAMQQSTKSTYIRKDYGVFVFSFCRYLCFCVAPSFFGQFSQLWKATDRYDSEKPDFLLHNSNKFPILGEVS